MADPVARRRAALAALRAGRYYVTNAPPDALVLEQYTLTGGEAGRAGERKTARRRTGDALLFHPVRKTRYNGYRLSRDGARRAYRDGGGRRVDR